MGATVGKCSCSFPELTRPKGLGSPVGVGLVKGTGHPSALGKSITGLPSHWLPFAEPGTRGLVRYFGVAQERAGPQRVQRRGVECLC